MQLRVAVIQSPPALLALDDGIERARDLVRSAAAEGAQLIAFCEAWLGGYPAWVFGMASWDSAEARSWYQKFVLSSAVIADGDLDPLGEVAAETGTAVVMGLNERSAHGSGSVYNSLAYFGADGRLVGVHRKLLPTHTERIVWAPATDGSGVRVHELAGARVGGLVCWEHWQPLFRQALHQQYEEVHIAAWPDMPEAHLLASRTYAIEGRCFVLSAGQFLRSSDVPSELRDAYRAGVAPGTPAEGLWFPGGSAIVGPSGEYVVAPLLDEEGLVMAEIDLDLAVAFKHDLDVAGHYSRPDVFRLAGPGLPDGTPTADPGA